MPGWREADSFTSWTDPPCVSTWSTSSWSSSTSQRNIWWTVYSKILQYYRWLQTATLERLCFALPMFLKCPQLNMAPNITYTNLSKNKQQLHHVAWAYTLYTLYATWTEPTKCTLWTGLEKNFMIFFLWTYTNFYVKNKVI